MFKLFQIWYIEAMSRKTCDSEVFLKLVWKVYYTIKLNK